MKRLWILGVLLLVAPVCLWALIDGAQIKDSTLSKDKLDAPLQAEINGKIDGKGTAGKIPMFTGTNTLGDSAVSESQLLSAVSASETQIVQWVAMGSSLDGDYIHSLPVWQNTTGKPLTITFLRTLSDTHQSDTSVAFSLYETASDTDITVGNATKLTDVTMTNAGGDCRYVELTSFSQSTVAPNRYILWYFEDSLNSDQKWFKVRIKGTLQ